MTEKQKFKEFLKKVEDPDNQEGVNYDLPENPTPLQVAKFKLCKRMLTYQLKNNLTDEEIATCINLSVAETQDLLFSRIEKFTVDRLITYASRLFSVPEIEVIIGGKEKNAYARVH